MTEQEIMKVMADIGPNAKEAVESWVALQWAGFWSDRLLAVGLFVALAFFVRWLGKEDAKEG